MVARLAKNARDVRTIASQVRHDPPTVLELQEVTAGMERSKQMKLAIKNTCGAELAHAWHELAISQTSTFEHVEKEFFTSEYLLRYFRCERRKLERKEADWRVGVHLPHRFFLLGHGVMVRWELNYFLARI